MSSTPANLGVLPPLILLSLTYHLNLSPLILLGQPKNACSNDDDPTSDRLAPAEADEGTYAS